MRPRKESRGHHKGKNGYQFQRQQEAVSEEIPLPNKGALEYLRKLVLCLPDASRDPLSRLQWCKERALKFKEQEFARIQPERFSGWFRQNRARSFSSGIFGEILQEAWSIKQDVRQNSGDEEVRMILHEDLRYLLLQHVVCALQVPMVVSMFNIKGGNRKGHGDLRDAIDFLLLLSEIMVEEDVHFIVLMMFCRESFLDFNNSDPKARAMLLCGGLRLIDTMRHRGMDITKAIECLVDIMGTLVDEVETLNILLMRPMDYKFVEETTLPWHQNMFDSQSGNLEYFKMLRSCDQFLLRAILVHFQRICCSMSDAADRGHGEALIACSHLHRLFRSESKADILIMLEVLKLLYTVMAVAEMEQRKELLQGVVPNLSETIGPLVDKLLNDHFPKRVMNQEVVSPLVEKTHPELITVVLVFLGKLHCIRSNLGMCEWSSIIQYVVQPLGMDAFWDGAPPEHRKAMLLYLSHALESGTCQIDNGNTRRFFIRSWIKALLEYGNQHEVAYFGMMLSINPATSFLVATDARLEALLTDDSATVRMQLGEHLVCNVQPASDLLEKLDKVVNKRDQDLIQKGNSTARSERLAWHLTAGSVLLPFTVGSRHAVVGPLLLACCKWVYEALRAFEQLYFEDGPGISHSIRVSTKANAAKGLQRTPLKLLPDLIRTFSKLGAPQLLKRDLGGIHIRAFAVLMSSFFDLPMVHLGANPVDLVALEALGNALVSVLHQDVAYGDGAYHCLDNQGLIQFILHYFVGESLEKSYRRTPKSDRSAMNSVCFLKCLFLHTAFQTQRGLCLFLPWILKPMIKVLLPDQGQAPSISCKAGLYTFLQHLFNDAQIVVEAPHECNNVFITGEVPDRSGVLHTGAPAAWEDLEKALQVFLVVCMRDMVACIREVVPPLERMESDALLSTYRGEAFVPMEPGSVSANIAAGQAQTSLSVLFGRSTRNSMIEGKLRNQIVPMFASPQAQASSDNVLLAKESLVFLKTLVVASAKGVKWAMPALPQLRSLLTTRNERLDPIRGIYGQLLDSISHYGFDVSSFKLGTVTSSWPPESTDIKPEIPGEGYAGFPGACEIKVKEEDKDKDDLMECDLLEAVASVTARLGGGFIPEGATTFDHKNDTL